MCRPTRRAKAKVGLPRDLRRRNGHDWRDGRSPMSEAGSSSGAEQVKGRQRMLGLLLAAAMFVLVVDTSLMNVSISAVVRDLGTTASGVQSAIALEALVSAAFI